MIRYILECIAFQLFFLAIYDLFLKKETFFQWNRAYLIGTYLLSLVLPWVKLEVLKNAIPEGYAIDPRVFMQLEGIILTPKTSQGFEWATFPWGYMVLFGGMFLAAILLGYKLLQLYRLRKTGRIVHFSDFIQVIIPNSEVAFSFFRSIFLGEKVAGNDCEGIIQHELVHIKQRHSLDLLFFELMRLIGWFNPMVYIYQNRISELHEFIADAQTIKTHKKEQYQLLLSQVFRTQNISFINQFHRSSLIKKRIVMLTKAKSKQILKLKYLVLAPVVMAMLVYSSCQDEEKSILDAPTDTIVVGDIENMTSIEENEVFTNLKNRSESSGDWELKVTDKKTTIRFTKPENGSYISGPNGIRIKAKMYVNSNDYGRDFNPLEDEAVRLISKLPKMIPGKENGKIVDVPFSIPITFRLPRSSPKTDEGASSSKMSSNMMEVLAYSKNDSGNKHVYGTVSDGGRGLPGVNIAVKGTDRTTVSDFDGKFAIEAQKGDIIAFQYINLPTTTLNVTDQEQYKVIRRK